MLLNPRTEFELAVRLREPDGVEVGELFSFLSQLYFRGKLTYARAFASAEIESSIRVITADRGLVGPATRLRREDLEQFCRVDISSGDPRFIDPLRRDAVALSATLARDANVVLLGSIATGKYVDTLLDVFGTRLVFPSEFVGRGDMSRGGLLLRSAESRTELAYAPVSGAIRHGKRPPKLEPIRRRR